MVFLAFLKPILFQIILSALETDFSYKKRKIYYSIRQNEGN